MRYRPTRMTKLICVRLSL